MRGLCRESDKGVWVVAVNGGHGQISAVRMRRECWQTSDSAADGAELMRVKGSERKLIVCDGRLRREQ